MSSIVRYGAANKNSFGQWEASYWTSNIRWTDGAMVDTLVLLASERQEW